MVAKADISNRSFGYGCKGAIGNPTFPGGRNAAAGYAAGRLIRQVDGNCNANTFKFHRGYTGHEHLPEFQLINMNGRMYDPIVGRFLSPDPFVADGTFSQDYNRYSYCLNNPLIYTDPSGEIIFTALALIFCPYLLPVAIGADIFSTGNVITHAMAGEINNAGDFFRYYG